MAIQTTNKYGQNIILPGSTNTGLVPEIKKILDEAGIRYKSEYAFDVTGLRRRKFDIAVFGNGELPAFLIEYDGEPHYSPDFYVGVGNRPCRAKMHVIRSQMGDAEKAAIAAQYGIPLLRITDVYKDCLRDLILAWVWRFVDGKTDKSPEVNAVKMLDHYGFDFEYTEPSDQSKAEHEFLVERRKRIDAEVKNAKDA